MGTKPHESKWTLEIKIQLRKGLARASSVTLHKDEDDLVVWAAYEMAAFKRLNGYKMEAWSIPPKGQGKKKRV